MSVTCPTCNAECGEHDRFCWSCGTELLFGSWEPESPADDVSTASARDDEFIPLVLPPSGRDGVAGISGLRMGLIGAAVVLLLAVAGWVAMTRLGGEDNVPEVAAPTGTRHTISASTPRQLSDIAASPSPAGFESIPPPATTRSTPVASPVPPARPGTPIVATPALQATPAAPAVATPLATAAPDRAADDRLSARLADTVIDFAIPESLETATGTPAVGDGTGGPDDIPE